MSKSQKLRLLLLAALASPMMLAGEAPKPPPTASNEREPYLIQEGDVLLVSVWKEEDLKSEVLVRPDGGLSLPLSGEHKAAGLSVEDLRRQVEERLRRYIPDPVVSVTVRQIGGNRIYVVGKVNRPGEFSFSKPLDIMQSLALAGGTTPYASLDEIRVLRRAADGRQHAIAFRYEQVQIGRNLEQNVLLQSGDTVVVP